MHIWYNKLTIDILKKHKRNEDVHAIGRGNARHYYLPDCCGFDIETTQIITNEFSHAYMYIWSFTFNDLTILGSYWEEFIELLSVFKAVFELDERKRLLCFIANESFEFQFTRKWLNVTDSFFIEERIPLYIIHDNSIEFRDALQITGGNLAYLAENYTTTQKLVGDLDYSILRNHSDAYKLTSQELQYVINDTKILAEYMDYYYRTFVPTGYLPLTKTGILRREVKTNAKRACKKAGVRLSNLISAMHPSEEFYDLMMKWLFRGGYVHGSNSTVGLEIIGDVGVDITSSYPNEMIYRNNYPMSKFYRVSDTSEENYRELIINWAVIAVIDFYDVDVKFKHTIESKNKIIEHEGAHFDNGRLLDCKRMRVFITEQDFDIYEKFYTWSKMEVRHMWKAKCGRLPRYLLDTIVKYYTAKAKLKQEGKQKTTDYILSKEMVNSGYGMTCTRMRKNKVVYDTNKDIYESDDSFVFAEEVSKLALLPQWGIYITSNARNTLLTMVYNIECNARKYGRENDCHYSDTDSIKFGHYPDHKYIIEEYNRTHDDGIKAICKEFGYDYEYLKGIGNFDLEMPYIKKFKHLGAKRYVVKYWDKKEKKYVTESTISGLPKKSLLEYCKNNHVTIWNTFNHMMKIPVKETEKLASIYNDEPHSDIVNGELMEEQSSICLVPIEFTMKLDENYLKYIEEAERRLKQGII